MAGDAGNRCEVVLYTPDHDATFWSLGVDGVRKVIDLWAERTTALGQRDDVDFVLVFENRGPQVGATIAHPHGQIYAYDHVPQRPASLLECGVEAGGGMLAIAAASTGGRRVDRVRPRGVDYPDRARRSRPTSRSRICRRSATTAATRWRAVGRRARSTRSALRRSRCPT